MGFARRLLAFFLGVIIGLVTLAVGIAAAASVFKVKDVAQLIDKDGQVVSKEMGDKTLLQLALDIFAGKGIVADMTTLEDVNGNFPIVGREIDKLISENKKYADLLGVTSFADIQEWRLDKLADNAVDSVMNGLTLNTVAGVAGLDLAAMKLPILVDDTIYVKLDDATHQRLVGADAGGICYLNGTDYLPAYTDDGVLKTEANGKDLYYHQINITNVGIQTLTKVIDALFKSEGGKINLNLFSFAYIKQSFGIDLLSSVDLLKVIFSEEDNLGILNEKNGLTDRIKGKTLTDLLQSQTLSSLKNTVENSALIKKITNYGTAEELTIADFTDGKKYVWDESGNKTEAPEGTAGETTLIHGLMSITLSDAGLKLNESDPLYKFLHDKDGNELTVGEMKNGLGSKKLNELISSDKAFLQDLLNLSIDEISDSKKYVWDAEGNKTEDANGETPIDHAINTVKLGSVLELGEEPTNAIFKAMKDLTLRDLSDENKFTETINGISVGEIIGSGDTQGGFASALKDLHIGDFTDSKKYVWDAEGNKTEDINGETPMDHAVNGMALADIISPDGNKMLEAICYDGGNKVTIGGIGARLDKLKLGDLLETDGNKILTYLKDATVTGSGENSIANKINEMTIGDVIDTSSATGSPLFTNPKFTSTKVMELGSIDFNTYKLGEVINVPESGLLKELADCEIGKLEEGINGLKLSVVIPNMSDSPMLNCLKDSTLDTLANDVNNLSIVQAFGATVFFKVGTDVVDFNNLLYFTESNGVYTQITNASEVTSESYELSPDVWLAILYSGGYDKSTGKYVYTDAHVTVSTISDRVRSVGDEIGDKTLRELKLMGLIKSFPTAMADRTLNEFMGNPTGI